MTMESNENIQFHFSIYKWPNKGIPITFISSKKRSPSRSKQENERFLGSNKIDVIVNDDGLESRKEELNHSLTSSKITKSSMMPSSSLSREPNQEDTTSIAEKGEKKCMENEKEVAISQDISKVKDDVDDEMVQTFVVSLTETLGDSIQMVDAVSFLSREDLDFIINDVTLSESNPEVYIDSVTELEPEINVTLVDDDDTQQPQQVEEIRVEEADNQPTSEEIKSYEQKVKQWSKGKEENIRALLSTMQYILWANSGWKPIPLAEIIEANAVKKAYQRALLCLHPDKLQQKGATPYQKFIAQKLFDILQEAWEQFNAIGLL